MSRPTVAKSPTARLASLLVAIAVLAAGFVAPSTTRAADPIVGIDVSHWQEEIDWSQVAASGRSFAYLKASEDIDFVDPMYGLNRARATAAGVVVGAYHFAQPDATPGDAIAEANHFLATAAIAEGDLPPVLDLEVRGGLDAATLDAWVRAYLDRIHDVTGVRGIIYVSPNFWRNYLADTTWFATNGYRDLWVAHWTTAAAPSVPAADWAGFGWTFWQHTSNGTVPGIVGRVDLDRFDGPSLASVVIDALETGPNPTPDDTPFTDIDDSTFRNDIAWLYVEGITAGCRATRYCPDRAVTRGEMATFLARALGLPPTTTDHFEDDDGTTHEDDVDRVAEVGLTAGCAADRFCPEGTVTRGQMASFLARVLDLSATTIDHFEDDDGSTYEPDIDRIARAGLTEGCGPDRFCPGASLSRGEMAAFLRRTFGP